MNALGRFSFASALLGFVFLADISAQERRPRREGFGDPFGSTESVDWAERRKSLMEKFDADKDGALSAAEREAMRMARFQEGRGGEGGRGRGGFRMMMPPEVVKKYDKDGNGELSDAETQAAMQGIRAQMEQVSRDYDANKNGQLDEPEMAKVRADIDSGKLEGLPRMMFMGGGRGGRGMRGRGWGEGRGEPEPRFVAADKDKDGRLSQAELDAARKSAEKVESQK
jgi:EF hand